MSQPNPQTPDKEAEPIKIVFNYANNQFVGIYPEDLEDWEDAYPDVDIQAELKKMRLWCSVNQTKVKPRQKKGKKGLRATIVNWLAREQGKLGLMKEIHRRKNGGRYKERIEPPDPTPEEIAEGEKWLAEFRKTHYPERYR